MGWGDSGNSSEGRSMESVSEVEKTGCVVPAIGFGRREIAVRPCAYG